MQRIFHTPEGVQDIYGSACREKLALQDRIRSVFHRYGCEEIETPTFEYFEVFSSAVGTIPSRELYKFFDREGDTLVLRPDFTPSMARVCATCMDPSCEPVRLCYTGNTFINSSSLRGRLKETTQAGAEFIGDGSAEADADLLAMTAECLLSSGLREFQVSVGQVEFFKALIREAGLSRETELRLRELISQKNEFGVLELLKDENLSAEQKQAVAALPQLFGSADILERARGLTKNPEALRSVERLLEINEILRLYGFEKYISYDFGMLSKYQYYTGIIFQAFTYGTGEPIIKGGRYDELMKHFGRPAPATGFAIVIDSLLLALQSQHIRLCGEEEIRVIRFTKETRADAVREAAALRREGHAVRLLREEEAKA